MSSSGEPTVARLVFEVPGSPVARDERVVALTFDDGPHPRWTPALLAALADCGAPATFFLVGRSAAARPELVERIVREGHTLGNHSWSHAQLGSITDADAERDALRADALLRELTGARVRWFRPPYRPADAPRYAALLAPYGITTVTWSVDVRDWQDGDAARIADAVLGSLHPGAIVLLHGSGRDRSGTVSAVPAIVDGLRAAGYRPVAL